MTLTGKDLNRFKYEVAQELAPRISQRPTSVDDVRRSLAEATPNYNDLKFEIASSLGIPFNQGYNGDKPARMMGAIGGKIGGNMVRKMIQYAEQEMARQQK